MREKHLNDQTWNTIIKRQGKKPTSPIARGMWITSSQWQTWRACWLMPCQPNCVQYNIPNVNASIIGRYCITIRFLILLVIERVYYVIERFWPISMSRQGPERCREMSMHSPSRKPTNGPWLRPQNMKEMLFCCSNNLPYDENDENLCFFVVGGGTNVGFMLMFRTARTTTSTKRTGPRPDRAIFATLDKCQESTLGDHLMVRMPRGSNNVQLWCQKNNLVEWNYVEFTDPSRRFVQCLVLWTIYIYIYPIIHTHTLYIYIYLHNLERGLTRYEVNLCNLSEVNELNSENEVGRNCFQSMCNEWKKNFSGSRKFFCSHQSEKIEN